MSKITLLLSCDIDGNNNNNNNNNDVENVINEC